MTEPDVFKHATPSLYDRYMGPLLFEPFGKHVAESVRLLQPELILETAAGTGIVTRAVSKAVPGATIVATDINPAVVAFAAEQAHSERVTFQQADAQDLPFGDETFDLALCLFGVMFFPDKVRANAEAARVLRRGSRYILVSFNRLDLNPVPKAAGEAVGSLFPEDPRYWSVGRLATRTRQQSRTTYERQVSRRSNSRRSSWRAGSAPVTQRTGSSSVHRFAVKSNDSIHRL